MIFNLSIYYILLKILTISKSLLIIYSHYINNDLVIYIFLKQLQHNNK